MPLTHRGMVPEAEFRRIYDEHFRFVWRSLRRLGVAERDAPDAVQEVFVVVHRKVGEFEGRSKMTTWLFAIAMRVAQDRKKRAHLRREITIEGLPEPADSGADIIAHHDRQEARALIESILDEMPIEQRAVFVLFELDGMSGDEIADLLDVPVGTVRSRLRLARSAFRDALARHEARERFVENHGAPHGEPSMEHT
jgi:RNA polymerase sigma-70 factor (ECF subfamily)